MGSLDDAAHRHWVERLSVPAYQVSEAARYARTSVETINNWERVRGNRFTVSPRERGKALSYMQLIEVGVVAAMRQSGVKLENIRNAREYLASKFQSQFPFAEYRLKTDGRQVLVSSDQVIPEGDRDKLIVVSQNGQLAWNEILHRLLQEFEYDEQIEKVSAWRVAGLESPIKIDPRIAFGAPQVKGIPTWVLRERWKSGESLADIADDYGLPSRMVSASLRFEGVEPDHHRPNRWVN
jgi:uncharacterized protein (DUF433 family)